MIDVFQDSAEAAGAIIKRFVSVEDAVSYIKELAAGALLSASYLPQEIREAFAGTTFALSENAADTLLCVSFANAGIAGTGSLLLELTDPQERGATALPVLHAVFVRASTIVPDLDSLHDVLARELTSAKTTYLSITTGPSRTADIERVLTIGVHGPKELHVLVLEGD
jgi:L-lactate dehydrogenase complex protein LldG